MSRILKSSEGSFRPRFDFYCATRAGNYLQNSRGNLCFPILESMKPIQGWGTRLIRAAIGSCYPRSQNRDLGHPPLRNEGRRSRFPPLRARPRGTRHRGPSWCTCRSCGDFTILLSILPNHAQVSRSQAHCSCRRRAVDDGMPVSTSRLCGFSGPQRAGLLLPGHRWGRHLPLCLRRSERRACRATQWLAEAQRRGEASGRSAATAEAVTPSGGE